MKRDMSIAAKVRFYVSGLMKDGREHSMGEALAYAARKFSEEGMNVGAVTVKRSVERVLEDKTRYARIGHGRYQYKPGYLQTHDIADYARERISAALRKAVREIRDCMDSDLAVTGETDKDAGSVRSAAESVLGLLAGCESIMKDTVTIEPETGPEEKKSVHGMLAAAREEKCADKDGSRDGSPPGKQKSARRKGRER